MGKPDMSKKINIIHVVEFAVSVVVAVCLADNDCINCGKHIIEMQFISASAFGILMITSVIFFGLFFEEDVGQITDECYSALGGIMCITSGILVLIYANNNSDGMKDYNYYRLLIGGPLFLVNGVIFIVEFFILLFKKEKLDA